MAKIFIDPGHGGRDPGAVGGGMKESDLNLTVALRTKDCLLRHYRNVDVRLSRTGDDALTLAERTDMANRWGADCLLSIHFNSAGPSARGYEDYIDAGPAGAGTARFREAIHREVTGVLSIYGIPNRGMKRADFHMTRESRMPACLVETLFLSNAADRALCRNDRFLREMAGAYARGIAAALALDPRDA